MNTAGAYSCRMPSRRDESEKTNLLQGTFDLLILRTLVLGAQHGQGIARLIQQQSEDVFLVDHGSLYLSLQRLEEQGWVSARWGVSDNNRKARFYTLTPKGRRHLTDRSAQWRRIAAAMARILGAEGSEA
jgi:PadR family transcriptional regulator PadR